MDSFNSNINRIKQNIESSQIHNNRILNLLQTQPKKISKFQILFNYQTQNLRQLSQQFGNKLFKDLYQKNQLHQYELTNLANYLYQGFRKSDLIEKKYLIHVNKLSQKYLREEYDSKPVQQFQALTIYSRTITDKYHVQQIKIVLRMLQKSYSLFDQQRIVNRGLYALNKLLLRMDNYHMKNEIIKVIQDYNSLDLILRLLNKSVSQYHQFDAYLVDTINIYFSLFNQYVKQMRQYMLHNKQLSEQQVEGNQIFKYLPANVVRIRQYFLNFVEPVIKIIQSESIIVEDSIAGLKFILQIRNLFTQYFPHNFLSNLINNHANSLHNHSNNQQQVIQSTQQEIKLGDKLYQSQLLDKIVQKLYRQTFESQQSLSISHYSQIIELMIHRISLDQFKQKLIYFLICLLEQQEIVSLNNKDIQLTSIFKLINVNKNLLNTQHFNDIFISSNFFSLLIDKIQASKQTIQNSFNLQFPKYENFFFAVYLAFQIRQLCHIDWNSHILINSVKLLKQMQDLPQSAKIILSSFMNPNSDNY